MLLPALLLATALSPSHRSEPPLGSPLAEDPLEDPPVALFALGDEGYQFAGRLDLEESPVLIPLRSLSERVPLFEPRHGRVTLALLAPEGRAPVLDALRVEADRRLAELDSRRPVLLQRVAPAHVVSDAELQERRRHHEDVAWLEGKAPLDPLDAEWSGS